MLSLLFFFFLSDSSIPCFFFYFMVTLIAAVFHAQMFLVVLIPYDEWVSGTFLVLYH